MKTTRSIDSMENGIVIDHIGAGKGMKIYDLLHLDDLDCTVVLIRNARSGRYGRKDIIKIEGITDINLDVLGFIDHKITVDIIREGKIVEKKKLVPPAELKNVVRCKNPRCITSIEQNLDQVFRLYENNGTRHYRCIYCEQEYQSRQG